MENSKYNNLIIFNNISIKIYQFNYLQDEVPGIY